MLLIKEELKKKKYSIDLVLLGTGKKFIKLPVALEKFFIENKIKHEIMASIPAYNTFNILVTEGRNFLAILELV